MQKKDLIKKITQKKEFSNLREGDVLLAFENFNSDNYSDEEKVKLTRNLLRKVFSSFTSRKILSIKKKDEEWFLKKHLSTRERLPHYEKVYSRIFNKMDKSLSVIDLGAGINGLSYNYIKKIGFNVNYTAIESIGQFVDVLNKYFKDNKLGGKAVHLSLFELDEVKKIIKKAKKPRVVFLFKVIDSLEMLKRNYSKNLILEISPFCDRFVMSFATKSMVRRKKFRVKRKWIIDFINENFEVLDVFEFGDEEYLVFENKGFKKHL